MLAVGGGDGTVSCAAGIARSRPASRWRSSRVAPSTISPRTSTATRVAKTVEAIRSGSVACVDVVCLNESHMVVNTASIGAYPKFVQTRERLEHKIGKPLAGVYAMFHTLRRDEPVRISYDNKTLQTSLFFLGNSTYLPSGFAPSRRTRMDDGLIDIRILETGRRFEQAAHPRLARAGTAGSQPALSRAAGARVHVRGGGRADRAGARRRGRDRGHEGQLQRAVPSTTGVSSASVTGRDGGTISRQATKYA